MRRYPDVLSARFRKESPKETISAFRPRYHKELFPFTRAQSHRHIGILMGSLIIWTAVPPPVIPSAGG